MSLVAYNSSDESDQSDTEDESPVNHVNDRTVVTQPDGHISDEDDYVPTAKDVENNSQTAGTTATVDDDVDTHGQNVSVTSLLKDHAGGLLSDYGDMQHGHLIVQQSKHQTGPIYYRTFCTGLPAPKASGKDEVGEDELEEEVKPKLTQISDAPKPPPKRVKQTVKISIPKLETAEDVEEEDGPVAKKAKTTASAQKGKTGLFALLPAPVHVAKKETNRILIPHALTKRPQAKKPAQKPANPQPSLEPKSADSAETGFSKRYTAFSGLTGYDSDSDEETTSNFFSLDSAPKDSEPNTVKSNPDIAEPLSQPGTVVRDNVTDVTPSEESSTRTVTVQPVDDSVLPAVVSHIPSTEPEIVSPLVDQDAPLSFKPTMAQNNPLSAASAGVRYHYLQSGRSSMEEPQPYTAYPQYEDYESQTATEDEDLNQYMQDEQFLRLQGKNKRGKEEINIIDANMDDFVSTVDIAKNLTEESTYQSHRKKDNNPTTQQRRKKQITYLAFQAKERELELKNSWAQSRMTKRQTQAKYGF